LENSHLPETLARGQGFTGRHGFFFVHHSVSTDTNATFMALRLP
jgi:hypothetical protein